MVKSKRQPEDWQVEAAKAARLLGRSYKWISKEIFNVKPITERRWRQRGKYMIDGTFSERKSWLWKKDYYLHMAKIEEIKADPKRLTEKLEILNKILSDY